MSEIVAKVENGSPGDALRGQLLVGTFYHIECSAKSNAISAVDPPGVDAKCHLDMPPPAADQWGDVLHMPAG